MLQNLSFSLINMWREYWLSQRKVILTTKYCLQSKSRFETCFFAFKIRAECYQILSRFTFFHLRFFISFNDSLHIWLFQALPQEEYGKNHKEVRSEAIEISAEIRKAF